MAFCLVYFVLLMFGCMTTSIAGEGPDTPHHNKICKEILGQLSDSYSRFVICTIKHTLPASSCTDCFVQYKKIKCEYETLVANCSDLYMDQNRLNIVYDVQKGFVELWNKAFCNDCFDGDFASNSTLEFDNRKNLFDNCLNTNPNDTCTVCKPFYIDLNSFYRQMDEEKKGKICFDIQDAMNRTRSKWSKELKCCRREFNFTLFIVGSSLFGVIPFIFYLGMYGYTKRSERNHEVLDSNFESENQDAVVASTSGRISSDTSPNIQAQRETSTSAAAEESTNEIEKKQDVSTEGQSSSSLQNPNNLISL